MPRSKSKQTKAPAQALHSNAAPSPPPLWKHQIETKKLLAKEPRVLDASDPGTGKTRGALEAFYDRGIDRCALVVAPKSLLESAWDEDAKAYVPDLTTSIARATNRKEAFDAQADIYITNTDAVTWLAKQPKKFFQRFNTLIVDELSDFKHRGSQRSKALAKIREHFPYREGLTGTPNSTTILDIWHQVFILDDGQRLGKSFFGFRSAVCTPKQVGPSANMVNWVDKEGAETAVASMLQNITVRHQFEDCMDIPPNHTYQVEYTPNNKLLKLYDEMEQEAVLLLAANKVTAVNAAVLIQKLLQIASGAVYTESGNYTVLDTGRYELIMDLIQAREHSVTFFNWQHQRDELLKAAEKRGITYALIDGTVPDEERTAIVKAYQQGWYQTIFMHPQTGAHGLTLTKGTATIWASPTYRADFLKQGMHRVYRGGQTKPTETLMVEAKGTVESKVYAKLGKKTTRMKNLLDLFKEF